MRRESSNPKDPSLVLYRDIAKAVGYASTSGARRTALAALKKLRRVISHARVLELLAREPEAPGFVGSAGRAVPTSLLPLSKFPVRPHKPEWRNKKQ